MNKNGFEQDIKEVFKNYQPGPPSYLWDEIDSKLDRNKKSGWKTYALYAASFALLLTFSLGGYLMFIDTQTPEHIKVTFLEEAFFPTPLDPITLSEKAVPKIYRKEEQLQRVIPSGKQEMLATAEIHTEALTDKRMVKDPEGKIATKAPVDEKTKTEILFVEQQEYPEIAKSDQDILIEWEPERKVFYKTTAVLESKDKDDLHGLNRWSFGVNAAPQYAYRFNSSDPHSLDKGNSVFENNESHLFTYNFGINAAYQINQKLSIESGLNYIRMGQSIRNIQVYYHPDHKSPFENIIGSGHPQSLLSSMGEINFIDPSLYFDDNQSHRITIVDGVKEPEMDLIAKGNRINQHLNFVEIPVMLRYDVYDRMTKIQLKGGVGFNYLVSNSVVLENNGTIDIIGETALIRNWNMSVSGGLAFKIPVTNRILFHLEPTASFFVNSMTRGSEYNVYPFGISLITGVSMPF